MESRPAQIVDTYLGYWSDEILVSFLLVDFGGAIRGIGGNLLNGADPHANRRYGEEFALRLLHACGAARWRELDGLRIDVLLDAPFPWGRAIGVQTEWGGRFLFAELTEATSSSERRSAAALEEMGGQRPLRPPPTATVSALHEGAGRRA
ncbi:MAG TPA: hypothetical protein VKV26_05150 [Dehalococcoidia bacterium]|nr:hypothetical protein [Dehalococcoidia bacterium]